MKEKICLFLVRAVVVLMSIVLIALGIMAITYTGYFENTYNSYSENVVCKQDNIFFNIIGLLIFCIVFYLIYRLLLKFKKNRNILVIFLVFYVVISAIWIYISRSPLRADSRVVESAARAFLQGDYSLLEKGQYLFQHPLQLGIILAMELVYRITGTENVVIFKVLNIVFSTITFIYLYKISNIMFSNEKIQKALIILMAGAFIFIFFNVFVYGNIVGLMFGMIAIYYTLKYLENRKSRYLVIIGASLVIAVILKSNFEIYMLGIFIVLILDLLKKINLKTIIMIIITGVLVTSSSTIIIKYVENKTGLEIGSGIPMISYIYMGMAEPVDRAAGWYNIEVNVESIFIEAEYDEEVASQISIDGIKNRISEFINDPQKAFKYYLEKIMTTWAEPTFQTIWTSEPQEESENMDEQDFEKIASNKILVSMYDGKLNKLLIKYLDVFEIFVFTMSAYYCIINFKKIRINDVLLLIIFLGGFLFHILWETKSIYAIPFFILLFPYTAGGIIDLFEKIENKLKNRKQKLLESNNIE